MNKNSIKSTLVININEANLSFLYKYARKYKKKNILKFLKNRKKIKTDTKDKIQHKNLDPWVQEVSINTGKTSSKHRIYNLGEKLNDKIDQIWDIISKKYKVLVWGSMNSQLRNNKNIKLFFPDPWNFTSKIKPKELQDLFLLPNYYAKNYTNINIFIFINYFFKFLKILISNKFFYLNILKNFFFYFKIFFLNTTGFNYKLFALFDIFSLNIIKLYDKKLNPEISFIFLNSIAHFQHNNWNEKKNYNNFFNMLDILFKELCELESKYKYSLVYNGFTQKKIKTEYLLRPTNPIFFLDEIKINYKKVEQNMTNGGIIFFKKEADCKKYFKYMKNFEICSFNLFKVKEINSHSFFYKIAIKTFSYEITKSNVFKQLSYYNKKNNKKKNFKNFYLLKHFKYIKTTGTHISEGFLLTKNFKIKKSKIKNHEIHNILRNFLNV